MYRPSGQGAVNQAIKAIAIARGYLELDAIDIVCIPSFSEVNIDGKERTAMPDLKVDSIAALAAETGVVLSEQVHR